MSQKSTIRRALLSVSDKENLIQLAQGLNDLGVTLVASGGTAKALLAEGLEVTQVQDLTQFPEMLDGRVKTLHPAIHGGILADRNKPTHLEALEKHGIPRIDIVVCNLYPFAAARKAGAKDETLVETIDIGGPTLLRAAAKNAAGGVTVVCDPKDYSPLLREMNANDGAVSHDTRMSLRAKAFAHTATYDAMIADWAHDTVNQDALPAYWSGHARAKTLRYGENPHQKAALYYSPVQNGVAKAEQLQGKELSYNNYLDLEAAWSCAHGLGGNACAIIKHNNPCGLARAENQADAFKRAFDGDPLSAFGSVIGFSETVTTATAEQLRESKLFVECIIAPGFDDGARDVLRSKENLRLLACTGPRHQVFHAHRISGAWLVQESDPLVQDVGTWNIVTEHKVDESQMKQLAFAMRTVTMLRSNAISIGRDEQMVGYGVGQTNRVDAVKQALERAGDRTQNAFLASDAFFPFADSIDLLQDRGIAAIVQPGGSKRDQEVIDACNRLGLAMVFSGRRHFRH